MAIPHKKSNSLEASYPVEDRDILFNIFNAMGGAYSTET